MLGMRVASVGPGTAELVMDVREDMINGWGICHGGLVAALADSANDATEIKGRKLRQMVASTREAIVKRVPPPIPAYLTHPRLSRNAL